MTETVAIDRVGAEGDGIATAADGATLYVPYALPGEVVRVERLRRQGEGWLARSVALDHASDARLAPPCIHFGECGGCTLQHWRDADYRAWKSGLLAAALQRAGFHEPRIEPLQTTPPQARRRMDFAVPRTPHGVAIGLNQTKTSSAARTNTIRAAARPSEHRPNPHVLNLTECHVLHPALFSVLGPLRLVLRNVQAIRREASIIGNLLDDGIDLLLRTDATPTLADRNSLIAFARTSRVLRISWATMRGDPEPIAVLQPPRVQFSGVAVEPPPGAFLQASREGETAIVQAVTTAIANELPQRARIAELYAGCGTLTFALAHHARVAAWEGDAFAVRALQQAANRSGLAGRVAAVQRDLARQPLTAAELAGVAAVVLDPPYAGAAAQMQSIAAAKPPRIIYVSCNPAVLARDARVLRDAGYKLLSATPIDQFLWSPRLESVSIFAR